MYQRRKTKGAPGAVGTITGSLETGEIRSSGPALTIGGNEGCGSVVIGGAGDTVTLPAVVATTVTADHFYATGGAEITGGSGGSSATSFVQAQDVADFVVPFDLSGGFATITVHLNSATDTPVWCLLAADSGSIPAHTPTGPDHLLAPVSQSGGWYGTFMVTKQAAGCTMAGMCGNGNSITAYSSYPATTSDATVGVVCFYGNQAWTRAYATVTAAPAP